MATTYKSGFTLIELSIVLVIIGLLVGGVLVGRDLIKSAEIRSQISQIEKFKTAINTFKLKYNALPGDMPPSEAAANGFFDFQGNEAGKKGTNATICVAFGNNDGAIDMAEKYVFWQHLSEAKLIDGQYGGATGSYHLSKEASTFSASGGNLLDSSDNVIWSPTKEQGDIITPKVKLSSSSLRSHVWVMDKVCGGGGIVSNTTLNNLFFFSSTTNELHSIDNKIDDGKPSTGNIRNFITFGDCLKGTYPDTDYDLDPSKIEVPDSCFPTFLW